MELHERLADVRRRPGAYNLRTLGEIVAFLTGVDAATDWRFLAGFRERLAAELGYGANLTLPLLLVRIAHPDTGVDFYAAAMREESPEVVAVLFDELDAFLASKRLPDTE